MPCAPPAPSPAAWRSPRAARSRGTARLSPCASWRGCHRRLNAPNERTDKRDAITQPTIPSRHAKRRYRKALRYSSEGSLILSLMKRSGATHMRHHPISSLQYPGLARAPNSAFQAMCDPFPCWRPFGLARKMGNRPERPLTKTAEAIEADRQVRSLASVATRRRPAAATWAATAAVPPYIGRSKRWSEHRVQSVRFQ